MTIASKLIDLNNIKEEIRTAIIAKGVAVPVETPFREYDDKIALISGGGGGDDDPPVVDWVRPSDWMAMPSMLVTDDKVALLVQIYGKADTRDVVFFQGTGTVNINWGDGNSDSLVDLAGGIEHIYDYANLAGNPYVRKDVRGVEFTTTNASTTITTAAPVVDIEVGLLVIGPGIPDHTIIEEILTGTSYRITNAATASATVTLELSKIFYRQALIEVDPETTIGAFRLPYSASRRNNNYLSIKASLPNISVNAIGGSYFGTYGNLQGAYLEEFELLSYTGTNMRTFLMGCTQLKKVILPSTLSVTNFRAMFRDCFNLEKIDTEIDNTNITTDGYRDMFVNCYSLREVSFKNKTLKGGISGITDRAYLFFFCYSLRTSPFDFIEGDTSSVGGSSYIFSGCFRLKEAPEFTGPLRSPASLFEKCRSLVKFNNTKIEFYGTTLQLVFDECRSVLEFPEMFFYDNCSPTQFFQNCSSMKKSPKFSFDTGKAFTGLFYLFSGCTSLEEVPYDIIVNSTSGSSQLTFSNCLSLKKSPKITTNNPNFVQFYNACRNLEDISGFTPTGTVTSYQNFINGNNKLIVFPALDLSNVTSSTANPIIPQSCHRVLCYGMKYSFSVSSCQLNRAGIVEVFENLGTASGSQTLTYSGNPGTASIDATDKAIATAKGWTLNPA